MNSKPPETGAGVPPDAGPEALVVAQGSHAQLPLHVNAHGLALGMVQRPLAEGNRCNPHLGNDNR